MNQCAFVKTGGDRCWNSGQGDGYCPAHRGGHHVRKNAVRGRQDARKFAVVLADPPWSYKNWSKAGELKNANQHYACASVGDLSCLPLPGVITEDALLFLWVTGPFIVDAAGLARSWGFPEYSGLAFTWAKQSPSGKSWAFGPGYWTRHCAELVMLFSRKEKPERLDRGVPELVVAPRTKHSEKPEEVQNRIERLVRGPYLELFARRERPNWRCLGNEITGNDIRDDLKALAVQPSLEMG